MTRKFTAVIGANHGDEGKGLMTDYFSSIDTKTTVVRFNGGAQAGHTVVRPDGKKHVFSHLGAGSLNGSPTYLSEFFICNPVVFFNEHVDFASTSVVPTIIINPKCQVSTMYDIIINQYIEKIRGNKKHGSVGLGIGETVQRSKEIDEFTIGDLLDMTDEEITYKLEDMVTYYYLPRVAEYGDNELNVSLRDEQLIQDFLTSTQYLFDQTVVADYRYLRHDNIVFEGAQGLMLDPEYGTFPHVTRSNCGAQNVATLLDKLNATKAEREQLQLVYVSRAYQTRHGAGPLSGEVSQRQLGYKIKDLTNTVNKFQDNIRYAPLDVDELLQRIKTDSERYLPHIDPTLAVTCVDQIGNVFKTTDGDYDFDGLLAIIHRHATYASLGPTYRDVRPAEELI